MELLKIWTLLEYYFYSDLFVLERKMGKHYIRPFTNVGHSPICENMFVMCNVLGSPKDKVSFYSLISDSNYYQMSHFMTVCESLSHNVRAPVKASIATVLQYMVCVISVEE